MAPAVWQRFPLLAHAGVSVTEVPEQVAFDPRFPR